ncbi:MAG: hypothetical protein RJA99_231 [Pseudomonadota bacterium]|jgi:hypothetical protein
MNDKRWYRRSAAFALASVGLAVAAHSATAYAQPSGVDPEAKRILKRSTDFLASQGRFSAETRSTIEIVLTSGQKLQFSNAVSMTARRPDRLWAQRRGDYVDQVFYYDGRTLTLHDPSRKVYASAPVPPSLDGMLDYARTRLDVIAPLGDFLQSDAYEVLTDGVTDAFVVGRSLVEGTRCVHIAFRAPHADWQVWIEEGARPLPRKIVITTRDVVNAPQFDVTVTRWDLSPKVDDRRFVFRPPAGSSTAEFLSPAGAPATGK